MWTVAFWKDAGERAIKTAAQTAIAGWGVTALTLDGGHWADLGLLVGGATALSLLTSIVSSRVGSDQNASVVK